MSKKPYKITGASRDSFSDSSADLIRTWPGWVVRGMQLGVGVGIYGGEGYRRVRGLGVSVYGG